MKKIITASVMSLLLMLVIGSASAEKNSVLADIVLPAGVILHMSESDDGSFHYFTVIWENRVYFCDIGMHRLHENLCYYDAL